MLKVLAREGNTLSPVVRNAWDGKALQTITRSAPVRATGAHIAIIGHITKDELLRFISGTELANGYFNRFMVLAVRRSKELPFGGRLAGEDLDRVRDTLDRGAATHARQRELAFDPTRGSDGSTSTARCHAASKACSAPRPAAPKRTSSASRRSTPRSTAETQIRLPHLEAALALWRYSAPVRPLDIRRQPRRPDRRRDLGRSPRNAPPASPAPRSRDMFSRNKKAREIDRALTVLEEAGRLATRDSAATERGRHAEVWIPITAQAA